MFGYNKNPASLFVVVVAGFFSVTTAAITNPQGFEYIKDQAVSLLKILKMSTEPCYHSRPASNETPGTTQSYPSSNQNSNESTSFETDANGRIRIILPEETESGPL